jgi:hypothetical protein
MEHVGNANYGALFVRSRESSGALIPEEPDIEGAPFREEDRARGYDTRPCSSHH